MSITSLCVSNSSIEDLWKLETIGILDPSESKTKEERELQAKLHFMETVKRTPEGRYTVSLPWMEEGQSIPDNKVMALKRLEDLEGHQITGSMKLVLSWVKLIGPGALLKAMQEYLSLKANENN